MAIFKNNLEKSIFATLAYFDVFDYPLTLFEIWKWLYQNEDLKSTDSIANIEKTLENSEALESLISSKWGFYFLNGRKEIVKLRQEKYNLAEEKFKKALRIGRLLRFIPHIKMIAVCNSLAWSNPRKEGDLDFFIVTSKNKIWTVRFWATSFLKLFGLRPTKNKTRDKICLSFFVDEENFDLEPLALGEDIYLLYWIIQIVPVYDKDGIYQKFLKANEWIKKYLPNSFGSEVSERRKVLSRAPIPGIIASPDEIGTKQSYVSINERDCFGVACPCNDCGEKFFRWIQMKVMPSKLKEMANRDSRVITSDGILKFHDNDRRAEFKKKWEEKLLNC